MKKIAAAVVDPAIVAALKTAPPSLGWKSKANNVLVFKKKVTADLLINQSQRCAYCGTRLFEKKPARDHVASKGIHPEFTFEIENLVLTCYCCNSEQKGEIETVSFKDPAYARCRFTIVHPILDDPDQHIRFIGYRSQILIQAINGSQKGLETIRMFDLASPNRSKERAKDALSDSDAEHLQGRYKRLFERVVLAPLPMKLVLKLRS